MKPMKRLLVLLSVGLALFTCALAIQGVSAEAAAFAAPLRAAEAKGLVILTHGSNWFFRDALWRYPAFEDHEQSFTFIKRLPLDEVLEEHTGLSIAHGWLTLQFELDRALEDALVFDLSGSTADYGGLRLTMDVTAPGDVRYRSWNHISERSLHIDQPPQGQYTVAFYTDLGADFSLRIGTARSPFLTADLLSYAFLLVPDVDPLSPREVDSVERFLQGGGNLVVLSDLIMGPTYSSSSNFGALNTLLAPCDMQFTGQLLTSTHQITANGQSITVLSNIVPHEITQGITQVVSTGSTLALTGTAQGLVFDAQAEAAVAVSTVGRGQCLALGVGIGFNSDFWLRQNDPLADNTVRWAQDRAPYVVYLPLISKVR
jgi:hypothetical protein